MKLFKNKKGLTVADLQRIGIALIVIALTLGLGAQLLTAVMFNASSGCAENATTTLCVAGTDTWTSNISGLGLSGLLTLGTWLPTIALVVVIAVIIGVIMMYLAKRYG